MNKQVEVSSYGLFVISVAQMSSFLKEEKKSRTKKVLALFQKEQDLYQRSISTGSWLPIPQINSISYEIKVTNLGDSLSDECEQVYEYESFNLSVGGDDSIWIGSIGLLYTWDVDKFVGDAITYTTLDGDLLASALRFPLDKGKYLVKIQGYRLKEEQASSEVNSGFLFTFTKVEGFESTNDPREDKYMFNTINKE